MASLAVSGSEVVRALHQIVRPPSQSLAAGSRVLMG